MGEEKEPVTKMPSTELLDRALDDGESLAKKILNLYQNFSRSS